MALLLVTAVTAAVVLSGFCLTVGLCLDRDRVRSQATDLARLRREFGPYLAFALCVFVLKLATSDRRLRLSYALDWDVTGHIYAIEGTLVGHLQSVVPEVTYGLFSGMYMFGFPYLLLVPPILYAVLPSARYGKELLVAYVLNYILGAACYTLFIAYGPRNHVPESVDGAMYRLYPQSQELTAAVSSGTDVFPSLHTSLSIVVLLFAWRTRRIYPLWFSLSAVTVTAVVLSTMILGIHWLTDVVAGVVLGAGSVAAAPRIVARVEGEPLATLEREPDSTGTDVGD